MKKFAMIFLVLLVLVSLTTSLSLKPNIAKTTEVSDKVKLSGRNKMLLTSTSNQLGCGGVIRATGSFRLQYKPFEEILPHERCVWIVVYAVGTNVSNYYTVAANNLGFQPSHRLLTYAALRKGAETTLQNYPSGPGTSIQMSGRVLLVTFHSKENTTGQSGFIITISPGPVSSGVNPSSRYEILKHGDFQHQHPISGNYLNNELTALVLPPVFSEASGFLKQIVRCKEIRLESSLLDWIGVHMFDARTSSWIFKGRLGNGFNVEKITHYDIILIVFDSDYSVTYQGFELYTMIA